MLEAGAAANSAARTATSCCATDRPGRTARAAGGAPPAAGRTSRRRRGARRRRWRSPAPKACSSPTRAAATRSRTTRSSRSCRAGRGIVIHRDTCGNVEDYRKHPGEMAAGGLAGRPRRAIFSSEIRVEAVNRMGMLAAMSAAIAGTDTNIGHVTVEQRDGDVSLMRLEVEVKRPQAPGAGGAHHPPHARRACACRATRPRARTHDGPTDE